MKTVKIFLVCLLALMALTAKAADYDFTGSKLIESDKTMTLIIKCQPAYTFQKDDMMELLVGYEFLGATIESAAPIEEFGSGLGRLQMRATTPFTVNATGIEITVKNFERYTAPDSAILSIPMVDSWGQYKIPIERDFSEAPFDLKVTVSNPVFAPAVGGKLPVPIKCTVEAVDKVTGQLRTDINTSVATYSYVNVNIRDTVLRNDFLVWFNDPDQETSGVIDMKNGSAEFTIHAILDRSSIKRKVENAELTANVHTKFNDVTSAPVTVTVNNNPKFIKGIVKDDLGNPLQGCHVTLYERYVMEYLYYTTITDNNGEYEAFIAPFQQNMIVNVENGDLYSRGHVNNVPLNSAEIAPVILDKYIKYTINVYGERPPWAKPEDKGPLLLPGSGDYIVYFPADVAMIYTSTSNRNDYLVKARDIVNNGSKVDIKIKYFKGMGKGVAYTHTVPLEPGKNEYLIENHLTPPGYAVLFYEDAPGARPIVGALYDDTYTIVPNAMFRMEPGSTYTLRLPDEYTLEKRHFGLIYVDYAIANKLSYRCSYDYTIKLLAKDKQSKIEFDLARNEAKELHLPAQNFPVSNSLIADAQSRVVAMKYGQRTVTLSAKFVQNLPATFTGFQINLPEGVKPDLNYNMVIVESNGLRFEASPPRDYNPANGVINVNLLSSFISSGDEASISLVLSIDENQSISKIYHIEVLAQYASDVAYVGNAHFSLEREIELFGNNFFSGTTTKVSGFAEPESTVTILVDGKPVTTMTANKLGSFSGNVEIKNAKHGGLYEIVAQNQAGDKESYNLYVRCNNNISIIKQVKYALMIDNMDGHGTDLFVDNIIGAGGNVIDNCINNFKYIRWWGVGEHWFRITTTNDDFIGAMKVVIYSQGSDFIFGEALAEYDPVAKEWVAKIPADKMLFTTFVPGAVSIIFYDKNDPVSPPDFSAYYDAMKEYKYPSEMTESPAQFMSGMITSIQRDMPTEFHDAIKKVTIKEAAGSYDFSTKWYGAPFEIRGMKYEAIEGIEKNQLIDRAQGKGFQVGAEGYYYSETAYDVTFDNDEVLTFLPLQPSAADPRVTQAEFFQQSFDPTTKLYYQGYKKETGYENPRTVKDIQITTRDYLKLNNEGTQSQFTFKNTYKYGADAFTTVAGAVGKNVTSIGFTAAVINIYDIGTHIKQFWDFDGLEDSFRAIVAKTDALQSRPGFSKLSGEDQVRYIGSLLQMQYHSNKMYWMQPQAYAWSMTKSAGAVLSLALFTLGAAEAAGVGGVAELSAGTQLTAGVGGLATSLYQDYVDAEGYQSVYNFYRRHRDFAQQEYEYFLEKIKDNEGYPKGPDGKRNSNDSGYSGGNGNGNGNGGGNSTNINNTRHIIDPSGYAYEMVNGERVKLAEVTATVWVADDENGKNAKIWDESKDYDGQINPQITKADGWYQWFTPAGWWQVRLSKEGYYDAQSEWLPVPPPQLDVNIEMTRIGNGIDNIKSGNSILVYPNPTKGELTINNEQLTINNVEIFDIMGRKQLLIVNCQLLIEMDISHLPSGIYFLKITTDKEVVTEKIIKQ